MGNKQIAAVGVPTEPAIRNGSRMTAYHSASQRALEAHFAALVPVAERLPVNDLPKFRTQIANLEVSSVHWSDIPNDDFGAAQMLDSTHALDTLFRTDKDCYWLGD